MTITPCRGMTFLVPSGPGEDQRHLHILLTDKCVAGRHLAIPVRTVYPGEYYDPTCLLREGDHQFITHITWVSYHQAFFPSSLSLLQQFENFTYIIKASASEELLNRVSAGIFSSKRASKKIRAYFLVNAATDDRSH